MKECPKQRMHLLPDTYLLGHGESVPWCVDYIAQTSQAQDASLFSVISPDQIPTAAQSTGNCANNLGTMQYWYQVIFSNLLYAQYMHIVSLLLMKHSQTLQSKPELQHIHLNTEIGATCLWFGVSYLCIK